MKKEKQAKLLKKFLSYIDDEYGQSVMDDLVNILLNAKKISKLEPKSEIINLKVGVSYDFNDFESGHLLEIDLIHYIQEGLERNGYDLSLFDFNIIPDPEFKFEEKSNGINNWSDKLKVSENKRIDEIWSSENYDSDVYTELFECSDEPKCSEDAELKKDVWNKKEFRVYWKNKSNRSGCIDEYINKDWIRSIICEGIEHEVCSYDETDRDNFLKVKEVTDGRFTECSEGVESIKDVLPRVENFKRT